MDKNTISPVIFSNQKNLTAIPSLTNNGQLAYFCIATAKNSSQASQPELIKAHSRLVLCGFFYARNHIMVNCVIMMDCAGGGLVASVISPPFSFINGIANPLVQTVAFRFATKTIVSNLIKETIMSNKPVSGIPSSDHDAFAHRAELHQKLCRAIIPFYTENAEFLEIQDSILLALSGLLTTTKELVLACNSNDEYKLSPEAMAGFIDSILCQVDALKVINEELWSEIVSLKKQGGLNK